MTGLIDVEPLRREGLPDRRQLDTGRQQTALVHGPMEDDGVSFLYHHAIRQVAMGDPESADVQVEIRVLGSFVLEQLQVEMAWQGGSDAERRLEILRSCGG